MVLENTQFEFMSKNIWTLPFCLKFFPGSRDVIENSIQPFHLGYAANGLRKYANWVYVAKYLNITILYRVSPRFQKWYWKLNWATVSFPLYDLRKYTNWVYLDKYLNIAILLRISPRFQKYIGKFNPTLFHWATGLKKKLRIFWKYFPRILRVHRKTYSLKYWTRLPSIGQSLSPSVCQSISPPVR